MLSPLRSMGLPRLVALALELGWLVGCGPAATHPGARPGGPRAIAAQPTVATDDDYNAARPEYDALAPGDPMRAKRRAQLERYLLAHLGDALDRHHDDEAFDLLKQALTLYDPTELEHVERDPALLAAAERIEQVFRRRGAHEEVTASLVAQIALGEHADAARSRYEQITSWLRSGGLVEGEMAPPTDGKQRVVDDLEAAAKVWPSPFVVERLSSLYSESRGESALVRPSRRSSDLRELLAGSQRPPIAYNLARLYLRVSKPEQALAHLKQLIGKPGDDPQLRGMVEKLATNSGQAADVLPLAMQFAQQGRDDRDVAERICRDATIRFPQALEPRLCVGELARSLDQPVIALNNFEEAVRLDPMRREAYEAISKLYQTRLYQIASDENLNVAELEAQLKKVEAFHLEANRRFPQPPISPSMAGALLEVGRGYFNIGRLARANTYFERSVTLEASAPALELMAQIHLKKGEGKEAAVLLERAASLPKPDKGLQIYWRAKLRRELADALELAGDAVAGQAARKAALADWDVLVGFGLTPDGIAEASLERGKLLYTVGDRDGALQSLERAIDAVPDRGSTYADVIAFLVPRGELEEALDAYHRALGRSEVTDYLKVYCSLWIVDLARRAGAPEDPLATSFLKSTDGGKWYDDLARWATGREPEATLVQRADTPARRAESSFYRSMRAYADGKTVEAQTLWKQVLETDMMAFFEYDMASFYLKRGGAPARPVLKSKPTVEKSPTGNKPPDGSI